MCSSDLTKLYSESGLESDGVKSFITYGEYSKENDVFTVVAQGDEALMIVDMPYIQEAIKGVIYDTEGSIQLKDLASYDKDRDQWKSLSGKNITARLQTAGNTIIIKNGKVIPERSLEKGDELLVMVAEQVDGTQYAVGTQVEAVSYIIIVQ